MAHNSISLLSLVLGFGSLLVTAQNLTPENGGGSPPVSSPTGADGAQQGASGAPSGINISKGALAAIVVVIAVVVLIGIGSAVLFYLAKKRQWELRKSIRRRTRRLTNGISSRRQSMSRPGSARPGSRPRPSGTRPSGTRPSGTRPSGARPSGTRPSGTRPDAARGARPQGQPADRVPSKLRDVEKKPSAPETREVKKETPSAKVVDLEKGTPEKSSFEVDPAAPKSWRQKLSIFGGKK